jgi:DNA-directed RNA polymerase specialized sigma24 family protein
MLAQGIFAYELAALHPMRQKFGRFSRISMLWGISGASLRLLGCAVDIRGTGRQGLALAGSAICMTEAEPGMAKKRERPWHEDEPAKDSAPEGDTEPDSGSGAGDTSNGSDDTNEGTGLTVFLKECERRIRAMLGREFPGLCDADADNVLQEVAFALVQKSARAGTCFWHDMDYSLAVTIARNKARDVFRRHSREEDKRKGKHERMCESLSQWDHLSNWERKEMETIVVTTAEGLSPFEQWLWQQYVDHYPASRRGNYLAKVTGLPFVSKEMKGWIDGIRERFLNNLRKGGYDFDHFN